ncbi:FH6 [Symbiodinium natans]|uniref:FH6 protein n=1 Tax=Symbiodinium natans TaxID=878477 RepID=A0A812RPB2_9DINO|nr:FH6 [Symbiodinium natans]
MHGTTWDYMGQLHDQVFLHMSPVAAQASDAKVAAEADKDGKAANDDFNVLDLLRHLQEQEGYEVYDIFERGRERVPTQVRLWLEDKEDWLATSDAKPKDFVAANKDSDAPCNSRNSDSGDSEAKDAESDHWVLLTMPKPAAKGRAKPPGAKGKGPPPPPKGGPKAKSKPPPPPAPGSKDSARQPPNRRQSMGKAPPPPPFGKRLHWKLLPPATLDNTIFEELQAWDKVAPPLDTKQLERLFTPSERSLGAGAPITCTPVPPGKSGSGKMCLMDPKRAQNLAIILRQVALPTEELCDVVRGLRLQHPISTETLEHIHEFLLPPLLESTEMLASYDGPTENLRDVERQLLPLARIPRLKARVKCLLFGKTMPGLRAGLEARIRTLQEACNEVRQSQALKRIYAMVLRVGNYLNHGVDAPDAGGLEARGFAVESLLKLRDFRQGGESSVTALHCVALHLLPIDPQLPAKFREELKAALEVGGDATGASVGPSSNIGELREAVGRFRHEADLLRDEADRHAASYDNVGGGPGGPSPLATLQQLAKDATRMADQLDAEVSDAISEALRLLEYFGERRGAGVNSTSKEDELVERFFITLKDFGVLLEASWREVVEQPRKLRLEAAGVSAAAREEPGQRISSPKTSVPGKEEKPGSEDAGEAPSKAPKKPGLGFLAGEAVAAVRRRSRATPPARPAAFALAQAAGTSGPSWLLRNGAAASELD